MKFKLSILLILTFSIFNQCKQNKQLNEEQQIEIIINSDNWVLNNWVTDSIEILVKAEKPITLDFDQENKKLSGNAGCNQYFGNYTLDDNHLKAGPMGSTMMFCGEEIMDQEVRFLSLFEEGMEVSKKYDLLILKNKNNQLTFKSIQK